MKILAKSFFVLAFWMSFAALANEPFQLNQSTQVVFATKDQGQKALTKVDEFVSRLSRFDRSSRLKTDKAVPQQQYLEFVKQQVIDWPEKDVLMIKGHLEAVKKAFAGFNIPLPSEVIIVKTTGKEEGDAAYTRGNVIVFNDNMLGRAGELFRTVLFHEFFHVLSRNNPELKKALYGLIGFHNAKELVFPKSLAARKITNPDAPINDHFMKVSHNGRAMKIVPILFGVESGYDIKKGGPFFNYLQFKLLAVNFDNKTKGLTAALLDGKPQLFGPGEIKDYFKNIGANTNYIIHPEEVLADNFAYLMMAKPDLPNPEIVEGIGKLLTLK